MNTRTRIIIGSIAAVIVISLITFFVFFANQKPQTVTKATVIPENRSTSELLAAITAKRSELTDDGKPTFAIDSVKKPQSKWYVATIFLLDDPQKANPAKILLHDTSSGLDVVLGPGTAFLNEQTQALDIPGPVATELNK